MMTRQCNVGSRPAQWLLAVCGVVFILVECVSGGVAGVSLPRGGVPEPAAVVAGRGGSGGGVEQLRSRAAPLPAYCGPCDRRACPLITPDTCPGRIAKDPCDCCPICDLSVSTGGPPDNLTSSCAAISCPRRQMCVLNIQGIPMCRCPSEYFCKQQNKRKICGRNGITYKSKCYLQVDECVKNQKIRIAHPGRCTKSSSKRRQMAGANDDHDDTTEWMESSTTKPSRRINHRDRLDLEETGDGRKNADERRAERKEDRRIKRKEKKKRRRNRNKPNSRGDRDERRQRRRDRSEVPSYS